MNIRAQFYKLLAQKLLNIINEQDQSIIKHVDFWNQQYNEDWKIPFNHPAVFLEIKSIPWQTTGKHKQLGEMQFDLHIASSTKAKSSYNNQFTDRFLEHLELIDLIHYWITGYNGDFFGSISRIASTHDSFYDDIIKHIESYKCTVQDVSAMRECTKVEGDKLIIKI
jgi:hypothetical protein